MPTATYEPIATRTLTVNAATVVFSSIPQTYTDLVLFSSIRSASSGDFVLARLNGVTTGYTAIVVEGTGSGTGSYSYTDAGIHVGSSNDSSYTANSFASNATYFPNYAGSANKSASSDFVTETNAVDGTRQKLSAELWSNTAAITSMTIVQKAGQSFAQNSTFTLYGIKKD